MPSSSRVPYLAKKHKPPLRSEGAGFQIVDILASFEYAEETDPFLIWHELPRKKTTAKEMPGAPMHPHRGFSEVPYAKLIENSELSDGKVKVNGETKANMMRSGDLEWGMAANGIEHEFLFKPNWKGEMHFFQLWVNLPKDKKRDPPEFQNASSKRLPEFDWPGKVDKNGNGATLSEVRCKILVGDLGDERKSPIEPKHSLVSYMDFWTKNDESASQNKSDNDFPVEIDVPLLNVGSGKRTVFVYCYHGELSIGGDRNASLSKGEVGLISSDVSQSGEASNLMVSSGTRANSGNRDFGFLLIQGKPFKEPSAQYGPFVMANQQDLMEAFKDFQQGNLTNKSAAFKRYD